MDAIRQVKIICFCFLQPMNFYILNYMKFYQRFSTSTELIIVFPFLLGCSVKVHHFLGHLGRSESDLRILLILRVEEIFI